MILILLVLITFIFGTVIGSFLNVIIDRLPLNENPFIGRSHCDFCKKRLKATDLIPLISYFYLKGECRYCKKKLSFYYPLIEFVTGAAFVGIFLSLRLESISELYTIFFWLKLINYFILISVLIVIFFTDLKSGIIPLSAVLIGFLATLSLHLLFPFLDVSMLNYVLSGIGSFIGFFILFYIANLLAKGEGMGFGDVIYVFLMGFLLGFPNVLIGIYISFVLGGIISLLLVFFKKRKLKGGIIAFGPFLVSGTIVALFYGDLILKLIIPYF